METLTEALPITLVVIESEQNDRDHHLQNETTIGTGDRFVGHFLIGTAVA